MSRAPILTTVSDNITNKQKNTILSAYAVSKMFTGITIPSLDLNLYITPNVIRVDNDASNGPDYVDPQGFLHVFTINNDEDETADASKHIIRQVLYPDSNEFSIQTRLGTSADATQPASSVEWSEWKALGGGDGFSRREELTVNNLVAAPHTLYYSYHNYTLILPDPNMFRLGTMIGLEQMDNDRDDNGLVTGSGYVKYGDLTQPTSADYKLEIGEDGIMTTTSELEGSMLYYFTVVPKESGSTQKVWSLKKSDSFQDYIVDSNLRLINHILDPGDPHEAAGYLKIDNIKQEIGDEQDTAISPYGVKQLFEGMDDSMYVTKPDLYKPGSDLTGIPANTIIKDEHITKASETDFGGVKMATDLDIKGLIDQMEGVHLAVKPSQVGIRRLVHMNKWVTSSISSESVQADLDVSNPVYHCTGNTVIHLPTPTKDLVEKGATVCVDLIRVTNVSTATVKCQTMSLEETFTNNENNSTLQLVFEASYNTSMTTYTWKYVT